MVSTRTSTREPSILDPIPRELLDRICRLCDVADLKSLRLTTKTLSLSATKTLFSHLTVLPTRESSRNCLAIRDDKQLNQYVTRITFHTSLNPSASYGEEDEYAGLVDANEGGKMHEPVFTRALKSLSKFPRLQHVSVNFMERCAAGGDFLSDAPEDVEIRSDVLHALAKGVTKDLPPNFHSLDLRNLQDILPDDVAESPGWKRLLGRVDALGLWITSEGDDAAPERNLEFEELHEFYNVELQSKILNVSGVRERLRVLKLYGNEEYWGYYPFVDLRAAEMVFPKLETLALGRMAFVYEWQVEWILKHGSTLKTLVLDDCPIFTAGRAFTSMEHRHEVPPDSFTTDDMIFWTNPARWHTYFRLFKDRLPYLCHFAVRTTCPPWVGDDSVDSFSDPLALENELQVSRYRLFDAGVGPSQVLEVHHPQRYVEDRDKAIDWMDDLANFKCGWWDDGAREASEEEKARMRGMVRFPECWREDVEALGELVEAVDERRGRGGRL